MTRDESERVIANEIKACLEKAGPFSREKAKGVLMAYLEELEKRGYLRLPPIEEEVTIEFTYRPGVSNG